MTFNPPKPGTRNSHGNRRNRPSHKYDAKLKNNVVDRTPTLAEAKANEPVAPTTGR